MTVNLAGPRHIAVVLPDFGGGGAERVQLAVIAALVAKGHRVDLVLAHRGGVLLELLPPEVRVIELSQRRLSGIIRPLARYLKRERPDAIHAVMWPLTVLVPLAHRLARSRALLMVSEQAALSRQYPAPATRALLRLTARLAWPLADLRIACADGTAADSAAVSGLPLGAFEVIHNPIEPPASMAPDPAAEALWGDASHRLINVGRLADQKNHALLLRAFRRLLEVHPQARLMILGEGPLRGELEQQARSLGIDRNLLLPGFTLRPFGYLATAELFVLSSDYEGLPLVLAEAMHAGLRIVSTDCVSGPRELLAGGRYGRLTPVGDEAALAEALIAELVAPRDTERQRARAAEMSGTASIGRYVELLTAAR